MFTNFKRKKLPEESNYQENSSNQNKQETDISTMKLTEDKIYELDLNNITYTILIGYSKENNSLLIKASPPDSDDILVYTYHEAIFTFEKLTKLSKSFRMYDSIEEIFSAICFIFENKKSFLKQNFSNEIDNGNNDIKELISLVIIVGSVTGKENEIFLDLVKKEIVKEKKVDEKNDDKYNEKIGYDPENPKMSFDEVCTRLKKLEKEFKSENEELNSKVYYLQDDNIRYKKNLDECKKEIRYLKNQVKDLKNLIEVKFKNVNDTINKLSTATNSKNNSANKSLNIENNEINEDEINENLDLDNNPKNIIEEDSSHYRRKTYTKNELSPAFFKSKNSNNNINNNKSSKPEIKRSNNKKEASMDLNSSINKKLSAIKEEREKFLAKNTFNEDTKSKKNYRKEVQQPIIEEKENKSNKNLPKKNNNINIDKNVFNKNNTNNNNDKEKESPKRDRKKNNYKVYDNNINSKIGAPLPNNNNTQTNISSNTDFQPDFSNNEEKNKKSEKKTYDENRFDNIDKWKNDFDLNIKKVIEDSDNKLKLTEKINRINRRIINNIKELLLIENQLNDNYPDTKNIEYELLYRASEDGDSAEIFHEKCDNIPFTLSLIKTSEGNKFGGYTENTWEGENVAKLDGNAFCFSLTKNTIYNVKPDQTAINCNPDGGISFGAPLFEVFDNCFTNGGMCYPLKNCCFAGQNYDFEICNGEEKFDIVEVEVYQLFFS